MRCHLSVPHYLRQVTDPADLVFSATAGDGQIPFHLGQPVYPRWFEMVDGGAITYVDATGEESTLDDVEPGRAYAVELRQIVEADGRVRFGSDPASVTAPAGPAGPAGEGHATWRKPAVDGAANTTTAAQVIYTNLGEDTVQIGAVCYTPEDVLTADDTNYGTMTAELRGTDGGLVGTVASQTTKITGGSGDWTAHKQVDFDLGAELSVAPGQSVTMKIGKSGTGVAIPPGTATIKFEGAG